MKEEPPFELHQGLDVKMEPESDPETEEGEEVSVFFQGKGKLK